MSIFHLDYETTSACPITLGAYRYACDPSTRIVMFAIAKDDEEPLLWNFLSVSKESDRAMDMLQEAINSGSPIYSHNAQFELAVSTYRMFTDIGIEPPHIDQWRCTLAMCRRAAAPESLAEASKFFGLAAPKDPRGKALIGIFSDQSKAVTLTSPDGEKVTSISPILDSPVLWDWWVQLKGAGVTMTVRDAWDLFCEYCKQDVRVEQELHRTIKHFELKGDVLASFQFDLRMNWRGVPVNLSALRNADKTVEEIKARMSKRFTALTGLQPGQRGATLEWLQARGYAEENLQSATVERALSDPTGMTPDAQKALTLRSMLSYAALAKIPTMIAAACDDGYVRGTMQWHVARTGRAGGRIIQPQNFRKSTIGDETHLCYHMLCEGWESDWYEELWDSPLEAIASSIRHFIQRPGGNFFDADFSSVENKLLAWCVGETEELEMMVNGTDMYKVMATKLFNVGYDEVTKEQRSISKVIVLGCGYGVGGKSVKNTLELMFRIKRTRAECKEYVRIYRDTHTATVKAWRELEDAAKAAVRKPGVEFAALDGKVSFRAGRVATVSYLTFRLPSGRRIYYPEPVIKDKFRPYDEEEMLEEPWKREERGYWVEELSFYGKITGKGTWGRIGTYGSKWLENLCFTGDSEVLTPDGWIAIRDLQQQPVFDGVEFVPHSGIEEKSSPDVIRLDGLGVTRKHLILTNGGWVEAERINIKEAYECYTQISSGQTQMEYKRHDRGKGRNSNGITTCPEGERTSQRQGNMGVPMRLRQRLLSSYFRAYTTAKDWCRSMQSHLLGARISGQTRNVLPPSVRSVSEHDRPMQAPHAPSIPQLRSAWHYCLRKVAQWVSFLLGGYGQHLQERSCIGSHRQQRGIFPRELQVGVLPRELPKPTWQRPGGHPPRVAVPIGNSPSVGGGVLDGSLPIPAWIQDVGATDHQTELHQQVFDILNCGPRSRFAVRAPGGRPVIAHNCQAMGADLLDHACQQVEKEGFDIRMVIHDQILALDDGRPVEEMVDVFCRVPEWASTFPQAASGSVQKFYTKD